MSLLALWLQLALSACADRQDPPAGPRDVVLIVIDTLRADVLSCYRNADPTSPNLEALAARGVLFEHAQASSPWTGPSVASLVTGRYPDELGIHELIDPLPERALTLAERFEAAGFHTGAVVSNNIVGPGFGQDQGYASFHLERYKSRRRDGSGDRRPVYTAERVTATALSWLEEAQQEGRTPFFLYVHYTDPHEPYVPPEPFRRAFLHGAEAPGEEYMLTHAYLRPALPPEELAAVKAQYAGDVAFADHEIGRLLAALPERALIVVTADHGEEFRDHGGFRHGHSLYQELVHVPLLLAGPGLPCGVRIATPVSHVDVLPTVLELAGLARGDERGEVEDGLAGRSLVGLIGGRAPDHAPVHAVLEHEGSRLLAVRAGRYKLIENSSSGKLLLFDLAADPGELQDLSAARPEVLARLREALRTRQEAILPAGVPAEGPASAEETEARMEELRALGYVK